METQIKLKNEKKINTHIHTHAVNESDKMERAKMRFKKKKNHAPKMRTQY